MGSDVDINMELAEFHC